MPSLSERLQLLVAGPGEATAAVLLVALPRAASDELAPMCLTLSATGMPDAVVGAVQRAPELDENQRAALAQAMLLTEPALRAVVSAGVEVTTSLIALLEHRERADSVLLLARLVAIAPWPESRTRAAEALLARLAHLLGPALDPDALPPNLTKRIDDSLAEAVDRYREHRSDAVLSALALLARSPGPRLGAILNDAGHPAMFALRHAVARADRPELRRQLLRMLTAPALAPVIQRNLHRAATSPQSVDDLLAGAHLLRAPARRKAMRAVDRPIRCVPTMSETLELSREAQANLPLLLESLGLPTSRRLEHLADLIALDAALGRLRSAIILGRYDATDARTALRPLTLDRSPWVARVAAHAALAGALRDGGAVTAATGMLVSPHPAIARRARWIVSRSSVQTFFEQWLHLEPAELSAAAMAVARRERDEFVRRLAAVLQSAPRSARVTALSLARRLSLLAPLEQELIMLAGAGDAHIASAAVKTLGDLFTERSAEAVRVALRHADVRVRANAVESLARHDTAGTNETMSALLTHRHNRLRANSVLALVRRHQPAGAQALKAMLTDDDPLHRISAIWVAGRAHAWFAHGDLRLLADRDRLMEIRKRAGTALRRLEMTHRKPATEVTAT